MNLSRSMLLAAGTAATTLVSGSVHAIERTDYQTITAAGACQSNYPAVNNIRVRIGGIVNIGTSSVYVVCSAASDWRDGAVDSVTKFMVAVSNTSDTAKVIKCTLQPGYSIAANGATTSQGSFPKSISVEPNASYTFDWTNDEVTGDVAVEMSNPNVTCLMPELTLVKYLIYVVPENVGA